MTRTPNITRLADNGLRYTNFHGTCVLPDNTNNTSDALGLPNGTVNDVVPSLNQGGSDLSKGGGINDGGGASGGGGGGGGHGR